MKLDVFLFGNICFSIYRLNIFFVKKNYAYAYSTPFDFGTEYPLFGQQLITMNFDRITPWCLSISKVIFISMWLKMLNTLIQNKTKNDEQFCEERIIIINCEG